MALARVTMRLSEKLDKPLVWLKGGSGGGHSGTAARIP